MPEQFVVPQFLDVESKIIGPVTIRQFAIVMSAGFLAVILYRLFDFSLFLLTAGPLAIFTFVVAFLKVNGQPFHFFLINVVQTLRKPQLRVWNKQRPDAELRAILKKEPLPPPPPKLHKEPLTGSRLRDLGLVVNTGGVFVPDDVRDDQV